MDNDMLWRVIDVAVNEVYNSPAHDRKTIRHQLGIKALVASAKYNFKQEFIADKIGRSQSTTSEMIAEQWRFMGDEEKQLIEQIVEVINLSVEKLNYKINENSRPNEHSRTGAVLGRA